MKVSEKTNKMVMTALMMCMIIALTMFIKIPIPMTQGYVHLGDAMIFLAVMVLGWKQGAVAAGVGSAMADVLCGMAMWAPWTLIVKFVMALIAGLVLHGGKGEISTARMATAMILGGLFMVAGYYAAEGFMYGNWISPIIGVPWNIGQFAVGGIIASVVAAGLCHTSARKMFSYRMTKA